jgi:TRAP-type uncharacterized transport system fused permease subunit
MMIGTPSEIIIAFGGAIAGIVLLSAALAGIFIKHCFWWERVLFLLAGALLFVPEWKTDVMGLVLGAVVILCQIFIQHPEVNPVLEKYSNGKRSG